MKTIIRTPNRKINAMIFFCLLASSLTMQYCKSKNDPAPVNNKPYTISGNANGSQVVPAVTGDGTGTMTGTYNPATHKLEYTSTWSGLSGAPTSGGFYNGASG